MASPVLFTTYQTAFFHKGGGEYELLEVAFNLRQMGLIADIYSPFSRDIDAYDTIIHFSLVPDSLPLLDLLKQQGKRIIIWPNFWQAEPLSAEQRQLFSRFFQLSDAVVFKSQSDEDILADILPKACSRLRVPAGVDSCYATPTPDHLFRSSYGLGEYILWVGIFEPGKRQLPVIKALEQLSLPLVFIGNYRDKKYYEACKQAAPPHFLFLPSMNHKSDILRAALRECRAYIEAGSEPGGKSVLEAVISGAQVVLPRSPWAEEHLGNFPVYIDPDDADSIVSGVEQAMRKVPDPMISAALAAKHMPLAVLRPVYEYIAGQN
jgi:glycosyltransferase involved in cell wall biosynthesis